MPKGQVKDTSESFKPVTEIGTSAMKDVSNILGILDDRRVQTNPFGGNISGENSYRRAERIAAALHLITNHIPDTEPLRISVRNAGLRLLEGILELRGGLRTLASEKGQSVLAEIRACISLVRFLAIAGYVSAPNANAVVEALDDLGSLIVISQKSTLAEQVNLSRSDLMPPVTEDSTRLVKGHTRTSIGVRISQKDNKDAIDKMQRTDDRGSRVLDILRAGGQLGIKDIAVNLPQYSEKMIQRELAELVRLERVTKIGEKRWSRYRISNNT